MSKKDLFDDSTMTFGEHLEVLRYHLWKAIVGLVIGTVAAFFFSQYIIVGIQRPVTEAMERKFDRPKDLIEKSQWEALSESWTRLNNWITGKPVEPAPAPTAEQGDPSMFFDIDARIVLTQLHEIAPDWFPLPAEDAKPAYIRVPLEGTKFGDLVAHMRTESLKPRTDGPDEAFMIYMKVSLIVGIIISSPWVLYQLWLFVAAGLYHHERKYVYTYFPLSVGLFLGGAAFCFFLVIPVVLTFLFGFNEWLELRPEMEMSTWITFALPVSLRIGITFQFALVML